MSRSKISFFYSSRNEPKDHLAVFRGLVDYLCGAFQSRSLSPSLHLEGVFQEDQLGCNEDKEEDGHRCRRCWDVATFFPAELVLENIPFRFRGGLCLSYSECIEALASRHDNPLRFQPQAVTKCFLRMTKSMFGSGRLYPDRGIEDSFERIKKSQGGEVDKMGEDRFVDFHYMKEKDMEALKKFSTAIGPSVMNSIPMRELLSAVYPLGKATEDGKKRVLVRQIFESLVELGFELASKDFVLVDPLEETALKQFYNRFLGCSI